MTNGIGRTVLMLFPDGRTYSGITGCQIVSVPDTWTNEQIEDALRGNEHSEELLVVTTFHTGDDA